MLVFVDHQKEQKKDTVIFSSINKTKRNQVDSEGLLYLLFKVKLGRGGGKRMKGSNRSKRLCVCMVGYSREPFDFLLVRG